MKKNRLFPLSFFAITVSMLALVVLQIGCMNNETPKPMTNEQAVARGKYLVTMAGCNDCHSPKIFTAMGPVVDSTKVLSGHPGTSQLPPIDTNALHPGYWYSAGPDLTAWVGPWGISFTANLTPDSTTGIGAWNEETFIKTIKSGKHLGLEGGRPILPPMPWDMYRNINDEDFHAIYTYLRSLPAVKNQVPAPLSPPEVIAMAGNKKK